MHDNQILLHIFTSYMSLPKKEQSSVKYWSLFKNAICINSNLCPSKASLTFLKSKIIQKPQFPPTLLANFWYLTITKLVSDGKWQYLGLAPL